MKGRSNLGIKMFYTYFLNINFNCFTVSYSIFYCVFVLFLAYVKFNLLELYKKRAILHIVFLAILSYFLAHLVRKCLTQKRAEERDRKKKSLYTRYIYLFKSRN